MGRWRPSVTTIVLCAVPACASSVLGPSAEAWPSFALPTHARGPTHERLGPSPCCSAQPAAPGPFQECAGAPQSGVTPARGRASALFLGLHVDSSSASHAFLAVNVPDGEVACPVHLPSPSVASRGDVIICKVQVSASFLGAVCPTGAQVGGQRLRPRGQGGGRLCQNGRRSRARGRPQASRRRHEAEGQGAAVLSQGQTAGQAWQARGRAHLLGCCCRKLVCACVRGVRQRGGGGPEPLLPVALAWPAVCSWLCVLMAC